MIMGVMLISCASVNKDYVNSDIPLKEHAYLVTEGVDIVSYFGIINEPKGIKAAQVYKNGIFVPHGE